MTAEEFAEQFPDEGQHVEWKSGSSRKPIQEAIVAFSNAEGGVIMIGVNRQGQLIDKPLDAGLEKDLWETINEIESPGQVKLNEVLVGEVRLTVISVADRRQGIAQTSDGRPLVRKGKQNLALKGEHLRRLMNQRSLLGFDSGPSRWSIDDVDPTLAIELCTALEIGPKHGAALSDVLIQRRLAMQQGHDVALTHAGALYLVPEAPQSLGKCYIELFRHQQGAQEYDRRVVISGTPAHQVREATSWIVEQIGIDFVVVGLNAYELPRLPTRAVREALANAVAHRDYQLSGSAVEVHVTPQGVEVTSPGGLIDPITIDNLRTSHSARNRVVIQTLRHFRMAEDAGRGIRVIFDEMAADLRAEPVFAEETTGHVTVRLPIESPVAPEERAWVREQEARGQLRAVDRRVLVEAARGAELTNAYTRRLLDVDSHNARQSLHRLRDAGFLEQDGIKGGARYRLARTITPPSRVPLNKSQMRSEVLKMAREGPVTNRSLRSRLGVSRFQALGLLKELLGEGVLEMRGTKRGTHYVTTASE